VAKAIGMGVFLDDYEGDNGVSNLIETSRFRGKGCLSVLYSHRHSSLVVLYQSMAQAHASCLALGLAMLSLKALCR
jgi:hypothetical protein